MKGIQILENRNRNLVKNSIIFMIGNFSSKILIFFLLPLYTHYLNPAEYGEFDIYINILSMLYCFVSLQSIEIIYRFIQDAYDDLSKSEVISNSLFITVIGILIFSIGMIFIKIWTGFPYAYIFILYTTWNIIAQFCQQCIRGMNRSALYSITGVLSTFIQVASNVLFIVVFQLGAISLLWAHVITYFFISLIILAKFNVFKYFNYRSINLRIIFDQLRYSVPLMPNALCLWGISSLGRYLLLFFYTTTEVGVLVFATKFSQLLGVVNSVFFMAWQQSAITEYNSSDKNQFASSIFNKFLLLQISAVAVFFPIIKILVFTIMGEAYRIAWPYIPLFFIGIMFNAYANFVSMGFYGAKKTNTVFIASFVAIALYFLLGYFGAEYLYIWGVGIAYMISQIVYFSIMHIKVRPYMHIIIQYKKNLFPLITLSFSTLIYYLIQEIWVLAIVTVLLVILGIYFNKELLVKLLGLIKRK